MLSRQLVPHPQGARSLDSIGVTVARARGGGIRLTWTLAGDLARLRLPPPAPAVHTDGLWRHTCCEAFVRIGAAAGYHEFNFSPSGAWAAYAFDGWREGMRPFAAGAPPRPDWRRGPRELVLEVALPLELPMQETLHLALTAVVEAADGALGWWALAHPPGAPDFHHAAGFVVTLPPG